MSDEKKKGGFWSWFGLGKNKQEASTEPKEPESKVLKHAVPMLVVYAAWAVGRAGTRVRALLLVAGVVGQLFWVSWVWDRTVQMTWIP